MKRLHFVVFSVLILVELSIAGTVQTWDGISAVPGDVVTLITPGSVSVTEVDGEAVKDLSGILNTGDRQYLVKPGTHEITLKYYDIFELENDDDHESIRSEPVTIKVTGQAGDIIRVNIPEIETISDARTFAKSPAFTLIYENGGNSIVETVTPEKNKKEKSAGESSIETGDTTELKKSSTNDLDMMKRLWGRLSEDQRGQFLQWIVGQH